MEVEEYFVSNKINNIRVMKRVINAMNDFEFMEESLQVHPGLRKSYIENIMEISTINALSSVLSYKLLSEYSLSKRRTESDSYDEKRDGKFINNKVYDKLLKYINMEGTEYFVINEITNFVIAYVEKSIVDEAYVSGIIEELAAHSDNKEISNSLVTIKERNFYDMNYTREDYCEDLWNIIYENSDILSYVEIQTFIYYINDLILSNPDKEGEYKEVAREYLKPVLDHIMKDEYQESMHFEDDYDAIMKFDNELEVYAKTIKHKRYSIQIDSKDKVIELMRFPRINRYISNEAELLEEVSIVNLEKYLIEDSNFVKESFKFLNWCKGISGKHSFEIYESHLKQAFENIVNHNENTKLKIERIMKELD